MERNKTLNSNRAITLIALIITVILMTILLGVSVDLIVDKKLFRQAEEMEDKTTSKIASEQEKIDELMREQNNIQQSQNRISSDLKVGDYVNYTPEGTAYSKYYNVAATYSGYSSDQKAYLQETKWRVLNINEDGTIDLISEEPLYIGNTSSNTTELCFEGANGYNNGVELLNILCNELYGDGKGAIGARSLNIEDIQGKMDTSVWHWEDYEDSDVDTGKFGGHKEYFNSEGLAYYPARWAQEATADIRESEGQIGEKGTLGQSECGELIENPDLTVIGNSDKPLLKHAVYSINVETTGWSKKMAPENFIDEKYFELFCSNNDAYYLASRGTHNTSSNALFCLGIFVNGSVEFDTLCLSLRAWSSPSNSVRPLVSISSNTNLVKDMDNQDTTNTYWDIK